MTFIGFYCLFALTTAVVAVYELFWPVVSQLRITHKELQVIQYWKITIACFFFLSLLVAPLILPACILPKTGERFRNSLTLNLEKSA